MESITLRSPERFDCRLRPPGSKSITNRALLLAAIARGPSRLVGWLDADDTRHMRRCLEALGVSIELDGEALLVEGVGGPLPPPDPVPELDVGGAGTVARFLLAVLAASPGQARLDGTPRMRERPMATLIEALRTLGAEIECLEREGHLPLLVGPQAGLEGEEIRLTRPASSQFVSALLLAGCLARRPLRVVLEQGTPARPYVDMTLALIKAFEGEAGWSEDTVLEVEPRQLQGREYRVEPDASAASYLLALAAIHGGTATILDLGEQSLQGDAAFAQVLERFGAAISQSATTTTVTGGRPLKGQEIDLADMPDMTLTLAVTALFAEGPTHITGVGILRHHESDRLAAAATELRKLGAEVTEEEDGLVIVPPPEGPRPGVAIDTYDDHRMAMAFALVGNVVIRDPGCVAKTYPEYFKDLGNLGMVVG